MNTLRRTAKRDRFLFQLSCALLLLLAIVCLFGSYLMPQELTSDNKITFRTQEVNGVMKSVPPPFAPSGENWLGTDHRGYDMLSLLLNGAKYTLLFSLGITLTRFLLAVPLGLFAGATGKGRSFISTLQLVTSAVPAILFVYPTMYELIQTFGINRGLAGDDPRVALFTSILFTLLVLIGVFPLAHQFAERSRFFNDKLFVEASRTMGASTPRIVFRHLLPHLRPELLFAFLTELMQVLFLMGQLAILNIFIGGGEKVVLSDGSKFSAEVSLVVTNSGEWGGMIAYGTKFIREFPWLLVEAAAFLTAAILILLFFSNQLQKRMEVRANSPRARSSKKMWITAGTAVVACIALILFLPDKQQALPTGAQPSAGTEKLLPEVEKGIKDLAKQFMSYVKEDRWDNAQAFVMKEAIQPTSTGGVIPTERQFSLIQESCTRCHSTQFDNVKKAKLTAAEIEQVLREGKGKMPGGLITDKAEIKAMALYLESLLKKNNAPKPFDDWFKAFQTSGYELIEFGLPEQIEPTRFQIDVHVKSGTGQPETWKLLIYDSEAGKRAGVYRVMGIENGPLHLKD